jgi:hypothetical protein
MMEAGQSQSMLKQTLIAVGAMLGASALFVAVLTFVLLSIADKAVSSTAPSGQDRATAVTPAPGAPPAAQPPGVVKPTGGRS